MAKHLARSDVRRTQQRRRSAARLAMGTGAAVLGVLAVGLQANGSVLASGNAPALPDSTSGSGSHYVATAPVQPPVPAAGDALVAGSVVSASPDVLLSYNRSVVLTGTKTTAKAGKLGLASAQRSKRPAAGTLLAPLEELAPSSPYGLRRSPITGSAGEFHWGLDFAAACGTHVHSADAGVVRAVGWHQGGGGNRVEVDHGNGLITTYNHLEGIAVRKGQSVQAGDIIAAVGTTGASTGCHLHFETILNGSHTDPANWTLQALPGSTAPAGITMTDYRTARANTDAPSWAVSAAQSHAHGAGDEHETPDNGVKAVPPVAASAPVAPAPARSKVPVPSATALPAPSKAPAPSPSPTAVPSPTKVPAPAKAPVPSPTAPVPSPTAVPVPSEAPSPVPVQKVTQAPVSKPATEATAVPSVAETSAPAAS